MTQEIPKDLKEPETGPPKDGQDTLKKAWKGPTSEKPKNLTVAMLADLVPGDTEIYFLDLGAGQHNVYCPADSVNLIWMLKDKRILLHPQTEKLISIR